MRQVLLKGIGGKSKIMLGVSLDKLADFFNKEKTVFITDSNVYRLYGKRFSQYRTFIIEPGEMHKNLRTVHDLYEKMLDIELDRSSYIVGIGGGVICDIAGFTASTYLRGLSFAFVPTTLLAQVDASVGGKNGVNFRGYKNLIGCIVQPEFVLCDFDTLSTLPADELKNGFAELIKHALIGNRAFFSRLESLRDAALMLDKDIMAKIVYDSLKIKTKIVSSDEKEKGERRKLNFGHTFGHAFEKSAGIRHGEAVSIGMVMEARLSNAMGLLSSQDLTRIEKMLLSFGLPVSFKGDRQTIMDAIRKDKKREESYIHAVLLDGIGRSVIKKVDMERIGGVVNDLC